MILADLPIQQLQAIELKVLDERMQGLLPAYATLGSAGMDLHACITGRIVIEPNQTLMIPTGIAIHIADPGLTGLILPRSGLGHKHGIILGNTIGLIDSDYQGALMISLWNRSDTPYLIEPMARIAQLVIVPVVRVKFTQVLGFNHTKRGEGGFGSTGK